MAQLQTVTCGCGQQYDTENPSEDMFCLYCAVVKNRPFRLERTESDEAETIGQTEIVWKNSLSEIVEYVRASEIPNGVYGENAGIYEGIDITYDGHKITMGWNGEEIEITWEDLQDKKGNFFYKITMSFEVLVKARDETEAQTNAETALYDADSNGLNPWFKSQIITKSDYADPDFSGVKV